MVKRSSIIQGGVRSPQSGTKVVPRLASRRLPFGSPSGGSYPRQPVPDKLTQPLLDSSFQYVQGKHAFETAIAAARRKGWPDEEIARVTGLTVAMVEAVAGRRITEP